MRALWLVLHLLAAGGQWQAVAPGAETLTVEDQPAGRSRHVGASGSFMPQYSVVVPPVRR